MARKPSSPQTNGQAESVAGYFRQVFKDNPKLLKARSNQELLDRWRADHPGQEVTASVRNSLSNLKSVLRSKGRKRKAHKQSQAASAEAPANEAPRPVAKARRPLAGLEALEGQIDDCLSRAKELDREGLAEVISFLRRARNAVVWKLGEQP